MTNATDFQTPVYDVVVVGSGVAGMTTALIAAKLGLSVLLLEKSLLFGGTTAYSGGAAWIPNNAYQKQAGIKDTRERAKTYLQAALGDRYPTPLIDAFVATAAQAVRFLEEHSEVEFTPSLLPDYMSHLPGSSVGRTLLVKEYAGDRLGKYLEFLRPPLPAFTLFGGMQLSGADAASLRMTVRSFPAFLASVRLVAQYAWSRLRFGRATRLANGNALAGQLMYTLLNSGVEIRLHTRAEEIVRDAGCVVALIVSGEKPGPIRIRRGVVLASGGFGADRMLSEKFIRKSREHVSLQPADNVGDGLRIGMAAGGTIQGGNYCNAILAPVSVGYKPDGTELQCPHIIIDRYMPGCISVGPSGKRFVNEGVSYHTFVEAMYHQQLECAFLLCDRVFLRRYGLGLARPLPFSARKWFRSGYLARGGSIRSLATKLGIDAAILTETVDRFNANSVRGIDPDFGRGSDEHSRFRGDPRHQPNPSLGTLVHPPFYAVRIVPGDLGSVLGLSTDNHARVMDRMGVPIQGLYAVGLDMNSVMRGKSVAGGFSIGTAITFAYLAAHHLAAQVIPR